MVDGVDARHQVDRVAVPLEAVACQDIAERISAAHGSVARVVFVATATAENHDPRAARVEVLRQGDQPTRPGAERATGDVDAGEHEDVARVLVVLQLGRNSAGLCIGGERPRHGRRDRRTEEVVEAYLEDVGALVNLLRELVTFLIDEPNRLLAKIHVVVFGLERPVRADAVFDARTDRPTIARFLPDIEAVAIRIDTRAEDPLRAGAGGNVGILVADPGGAALDV